MTFEKETVQAMVHSKLELGSVEILGTLEDGRYKLRVVESGVVCKGIFNVFNGLIYADDVYEKIDEVS